MNAHFSITCIAQHPTSNNILYLGTGESFTGISGGGIYKSIDGGASWTFLTSTSTTSLFSDFYYINDIKVDGNGYVYVGASGYYCNYGGVFKSKDLGVSFTRILANTGSITCAAFINAQGNDIQISNAGDVYVSTGLGNGSKVYVSKIASYTSTTVGDINNFTDITPVGTFTRSEIAVAPSAAGTLYGIFSNGNTVSSIRKSTDYGTTWVVKTNPNTTSNGNTQNFAGNQAWYASSIAVDPLDANSIVIAGLDACRSKDGGTTFEQISMWSPYMPASPLTYANNFIHADQHKILFESGSSANVIFGNDGGIFYATNMTNAIGTPPSMIAKNSGLNITQYYAADYLPTSGSPYILAGTQDNGTHKLTTAGMGPGTSVTGGDGGFCHIDQTDGVIQISSYIYNNYSISTNSGGSFSSFTLYGGPSQTGKFINPTDYDDVNNILYTATTAGSFGRLSSVGNTNTYTTKVVTDMVGEISAVKVDPNTPTTVYVAADGSGTPEIYKITNANAASPTYTAISITGVGAPVAGAYLSCIDVEIGNSNHLIATCSNYGQNSVWESVNGGTSWTSIEGNLPDMPVRWCAFVPSGFNPGSKTDAIAGVYLATEMGVFSTTALTAGTTNWVQNAVNIGNVRIDMIKVRPVDGFVTIATHGRGTFSATLNTVLPIKVNSFTATKQLNNAELNWQMVETNNVKSYEIQWSGDGLNFEKIGDGNITPNQLNYQFTHVNIKAQNYYRIKFINSNSSVNYSLVRYINHSNKKTIDIFPNPFVNNISVRSLQLGNQIYVYNVQGILLHKIIANSAIETIDAKNYPNGIYVIKVMDGNNIITSQKIVKQ
jgi:Secretion system C-terminal sorting domain